MAHRVDIDSIHKNIFLLLNISYAAQALAQHHDLSTEDETDVINGPFYVGWLKTTLSELLIDISIKTRILLDIVWAEEKSYLKDGEKYPIDSREMDKRITEQTNIGFFVKGSDEVSIRESCNKIIHALEIIPILERGDDDHVADEESETKREWLYWSGALDLTGFKGQNEWVFTLHISEFCQALEEFVREIENAVDWRSIHYDLDVF